MKSIEYGNICGHRNPAITGDMYSIEYRVITTSRNYKEAKEGFLSVINRAS